jgi:hypothetical protein
MHAFSLIKETLPFKIQRKKLGSSEASAMVLSFFEKGHLTSPGPKGDACSSVPACHESKSLD